MGKRFTPVLVAILLSGLGACSSAKPDAAPPAPATPAASTADSFYAVMDENLGTVVQLSAGSGKLIRQVVPGERNGLTVRSVAALSARQLLVTYATGPAPTSNVNGGNPAPNTCGAEIDAVDVMTDATTVLWRVGRNQLLSGARMSPDGKEIAALTSPCVPSYFNDHLVVRRLSDGASWSIGDRVAHCHLLGAPQWTPDSAHLVVAFGAPTGSTPYTGGDGSCTEPADSNLVEIDASHAQPLITGLLAKAPLGCTYQSLASDSRALFAVQACGPDSRRLQGPATLVRLDRTLHAVQSWPIGNCTDGNSLAADPVKGVLVSAYLFCNPPLAGQKLGEPTTVLDRLQGTTLKRITSATGGVTAFNDLTW